MLLPITVCFAAAAVLVNIWLAIRIGKLRGELKIPIGDGGNDAMIARMRAQANFIEQTPLTVILVGLVELAGRGSIGLAIGAALFIVGRIAHAYGMDGVFKPGRGVGALTAMLFQLALVVIAVIAVLGR